MKNTCRETYFLAVVCVHSYIAFDIFLESYKKKNQEIRFIACI